MAHSDTRVRRAGEHSVVHSERRLPIEAVVINVVYFLFGVIIVLLALRFALLLFGANPAAAFSAFIYTVTAPLVAPFQAVFGATQIEGAVFEWSTLLAIAIYALLAWGVAALITAITPRASAGTVETVEEVHSDADAVHARDDDEPVVTEDRHTHGGTVVHG